MYHIAVHKTIVSEKSRNGGICSDFFESVSYRRADLHDRAAVDRQYQLNPRAYSGTFRGARRRTRRTRPLPAAGGLGRRGSKRAADGLRQYAGAGHERGNSRTGTFGRAHGAAFCGQRRNHGGDPVGHHRLASRKAQKQVGSFPPRRENAARYFSSNFYSALKKGNRPRKIRRRCKSSMQTQK